jgi:hypothetical protein
MTKHQAQIEQELQSLKKMGGGGFATDSKTDKQTTRAVYRVALKLKIQNQNDSFCICVNIHYATNN